ncbi:MAG TPA: trypsin-like peptidase domain-containing protein, partial [Bacteroidales bacterium]|nr:trypsin-like peptidase domain-containing protein [Bacteroidales bacterium]
LLKVEANDLPFIPYANSEDVKVGEWVLAVGNPFNLTSTVTAGIISAKARNINIMGQSMDIESFIQTDAAINPGNSGGALVNLNGELIGINSAIASRTGSFVGYSFAIPSNIVRKVVADFIEFGDVQRAYLGAEFADIDADLAKSLKMERPIGIYVAGVWSDGSDSKSDLKKGDIVLEVDNHKVNSTAEMLEQLSKFRPGDRVEIRIIRNGLPYTVNAMLTNKYGTTDIVKARSVEILGANFEPVPDADKQKLRIRNGVKVKSLSSGKLLSRGVQPGYIITRINNRNIDSVDDVEDALKNSDGAVFIEGIYPNGTVAYYAFGL